MKPLTASLLGIVAITVSVVLWHGLRANAQLEAEITAARTLTAGHDALRAEHRRLIAAAAAAGQQAEAEHNELLRLRTQLAAWRQKRESTPVRPMDTFTTAPAPVSSESPWQNKGRATAAAALETGLWAQARGDIEAFVTTSVFDEEAGRRLATLFAAQPEADRVRYGSPERMAIMLAMEATAGQTGTPPQMDIVEQRRTASEADVTVKIHLPDGTERSRTLPARQFADGWKIVLLSDQVDMLENALSTIPPTQRMLRATR